MYRLVLSLIVFSISFSVTVRAEQLEQPTSATEAQVITELQGYGAFSHLNKDWMLMALYANSHKAEDSFGATSTDNKKAVFDVQDVQRLEIKVATEKFTNRRFRSLWLEALSIEHGADKIIVIEQDLEKFFGVLKGPLIEGDTLVIESTSEGAELRVNYHKLATVSETFLPMIVQSLVGKHPPTQALKSGLMGESSLRDQMNLSIRFERLEPTLPRISEVSRWNKSTKRILASN